MGDDLDDGELEKALAPRYSARWVVDDWCRRLAEEVKRRRRADAQREAAMKLGWKG